MGNFSVTNNTYLTNLYLGYESFATKSNRSGISHTTLSKADAHALGRGINILSKLDYNGVNQQSSEKESTDSAFYKRIKAFADTYNYTLDSASEIHRADIRRMTRKLTSLSDEYSSKLKKLGITFNEKTGSMEVSKDTISKKDEKEFENLFGQNSRFMKGLSKISKSLYNRIDYIA